MDEIPPSITLSEPIKSINLIIKGWFVCFFLKYVLNEDNLVVDLVNGKVSNCMGFSRILW